MDVCWDTESQEVCRRRTEDISSYRIESMSSVPEVESIRWLGQIVVINVVLYCETENTENAILRSLDMFHEKQFVLSTFCTVRRHPF